MKRVALYVRVSTEEQKQHGISVDAQIYQLKEYAKTHNYKVVGVYSDAGISARKSYTKRPALLNMIADAQKGKIDLILITKLDRFFRSVEDYYKVIGQLNNVPWQATQEDYETVTSSGVFKVNIMLSVAQSEADRTSERIRATLEYKKAKGEYNAGKSLPVGYILKEDKKLYINPSEETAVREFFNAYINYHSVYKAIDVAASYGLNINTDKAYRMLRGPVYLENMPYVAEQYLTDEQKRLIKANKKKSIKHKSNYDYIFSGICKCKKCGALCVSSKQVYNRKKDNNITYTITYICSNHRRRYGCSGSSINEKALENYLVNELDNTLKFYNVSISASDDKKIQDNIQRYNARLKRLRDLYELGDIEFNEYKEKRAAIQEEIEKEENRKIKEPIELPSNWLEIYNELDNVHKRAFWSRVIDYVEVDGLNCKTPKIVL